MGLKSQQKLFFCFTCMSGYAYRELSMGQRRQAVFAACLVGTPSHILLDEPLEGMDRHVQKEILGWIKNHTQSGATILLVSHSIEPFIELASQAVTIQSGQALRFKSLPESYDKKMSFLEQLAEGGLPL